MKDGRLQTMLSLNETRNLRICRGYSFYYFILLLFHLSVESCYKGYIWALKVIFGFDTDMISIHLLSLFIQ